MSSISTTFPQKPGLPFFDAKLFYYSYLCTARKTLHLVIVMQQTPVIESAKG